MCACSKEDVCTNESVSLHGVSARSRDLNKQSMFEEYVVCVEIARLLTTQHTDALNIVVHHGFDWRLSAKHTQVQFTHTHETV